MINASEAVPSRRSVQSDADCYCADFGVLACNSRGELLEAAREERPWRFVVGQREVGYSEQMLTVANVASGFRLHALVLIDPPLFQDPPQTNEAKPWDYAAIRPRGVVSTSRTGAEAVAVKGIVCPAVAVCSPACLCSETAADHAA